jgi:hypothetical protein
MVKYGVPRVGQLGFLRVQCCNCNQFIDLGSSKLVFKHIGAPLRQCSQPCFSRVFRPRPQCDICSKRLHGSFQIIDDTVILCPHDCWDELMQMIRLRKAFPIVSSWDLPGLV